MSSKAALFADTAGGSNGHGGRGLGESIELNPALKTGNSPYSGCILRAVETIRPKQQSRLTLSSRSRTASIRLTSSPDEFALKRKRSLNRRASFRWSGLSITCCKWASHDPGLHFHLTQPRPVWATSLNDLTGVVGKYEDDVRPRSCRKARRQGCRSQRRPCQRAQETTPLHLPSPEGIMPSPAERTEHDRSGSAGGWHHRCR